MKARFTKPVREQGIALIFALAALVLLTGIVLIFFTRSLLNRQVAFASTQLIKTDLLAGSALDIICGEMRDEIRYPANNSTISNGGVASYPNVYLPKVANAIPGMLGLTPPVTGPIIRVSAANTPIWLNGSITASAISTGAVSQNGRYLSLDRWFTSANGSPQLGSQTTLPTWLFVTRANGVKTPAITDASSEKSGDFVLGRFAYTIYDTSGLLDASLAGFPVTTASGDAGYKSSAAYADLTMLGMSATSVASFVSWRNAYTGGSASTFAEWAAGLRRASGTPDPAALASAQSGHLSIAQGDSAVLTRADLLKNPQLTSATKLLTHFSRTINAPSYSPPKATDTNPNLADVRWSAGGSILHYNDDGTTQSYPVTAGDPMLQRRFSLAKLAWIGHGGPNAAAFAATADQSVAVKACFGLTFNSDHWVYQDSQIKTLAQVAGLAREPNLFELLKAGVLNSSLGLKSLNRTMSLPDQQDRDGSGDLQILRIGANMVDCADSDNFPTTITLNLNGIEIPVHGVEDLPYLDRLDFAQVCKAQPADATNSRVVYSTLFMLPEIFNPHRASMASSAGPVNIRLRIASGLVMEVYNGNQGASVSSPLARLALNSDLSGDPSIVIPSSAFEDFRAAVKTPVDTEASSPIQLGTLITPPSVIDSTMAKLHGFLYYVYTGLPENYKNTFQFNPRSFVNDLLMVVEYQETANDPWKIYDELTGNEGFEGNTGVGQVGALSPATLSTYAWDFLSTVNIAPLTADFVVTAPNTLQGVMKLDPRSTRLGVSRGKDFGSSKNNYTTYPPGTHRGIMYDMPFGSETATSPMFFPELWAQGGKSDWETAQTNASDPRPPDPASTVRPSDGWLGDAANPYRNLGDAARRPVILQRPFRSVGELGYVFRDSPWKTLSFFDETSGDAALLDMFSVADEPPVTAGRVNLDGSQQLSQTALLTGVGQNPDATNSNASASAISGAFNSYALAGGVPTATMPLTVADLATFMSSSKLTGAYSTTTTPIKTQRESVIRALASSSQTRTWNLLIDVLAQTGRYPPGAQKLENFVVDGEKRYWLSVAIDRYTGNIVSRQLEPVNE